MGKRLSKTELLQEITVERNKLDKLLDQLTTRQMTQADVTLAGWSVKDILGHLIGWQQMNLDWYAASQRGEQPELPAPGFKWSDVCQLNDQIDWKNKRRSLAALLQDYESFHHKMLDLISEIPDKDFATVGRFEWTGLSWTISDYIRANTASHYRWAVKHIRKWLRKHDTKSKNKYSSRET